MTVATLHVERKQIRWETEILDTYHTVKYGGCVKLQLVTLFKMLSNAQKTNLNNLKTRDRTWKCSLEHSLKYLTKRGFVF